MTKINIQTQFIIGEKNEMETRKLDFSRCE